MNQEPTQSQINLLTNAIEAVHNELVRVHAARILPFDDIIVKAFVREYFGDDYVFVAMKVEECREVDLPWIGWDNHYRDCWYSTKEVKNQTSFCMEAMMIDVSEQAKIIFSTFLI